MVVLFCFLVDVIANGMWHMFLPLQCIATIDWLMLLPSDRWNSRMLLICFMMYGQMLLHCGRWNHHLLYICDGRCYCPVEDGIATAGCECSLLVDVVPMGQMDKGNYFSLSTEVLCRTSSHIWGRWYLPKFLFRDGLFTLMYNASLIHLQRFRSSLPTMLKLSKVTL